MSDPTAELTLLRAALVASEARATAAEIELSATKVELIQHKAVVSTSEAVIPQRGGTAEINGAGTALTVKPQGCFSTWPDYLHSFADKVGQEPRMRRPRPGPRQITEADEALL